MASKAFGDGPQKPSFAKIAAMAPPNTVKSSTNTQESKPVIAKTKATDDLPSTSHILEKGDADNVNAVPNEFNNDIHVLSQKIENLKIEQTESATRAESLPGTSTGGVPEPDGALKTEGSLEDDQTQLSNSSTKPTSFDSKSMASVTTFAMDEKDSLRPDDSASVKAAEEEESLSGPASAAPSSRVGSEAGVRPFRDQYREIMVQRNVAGVTGISRFNDGTIQMPSGMAGQPMSSPLHGSDAFQNVVNSLGFPAEPDEKLVEALNTPKDRLFLLQLEQKIVAFIKETKDEILDLPPCNSFCRLLAHKLADYYHLTHLVDNNISAVRLYRTPVTRIPVSLAMLPIPANSAGTPPPNAPRRQIMRRTGAGGSTAVSSATHSKATSEVGGSDDDPSRVMSPAEPTPAKEKMALTREEREAKYKEARERIFGPNDDSASQETSAAGETSADMSRSSSSSGKKKPRKQRSPVDDSFQARSQFVYTGGPYTAAGPGNYQPSFPENGYVPPYSVAPESGMSLNYVPTQPQGAQMYMTTQPMGNMQQYPMGSYGQPENWAAGSPAQWPPQYFNYGQGPQIPSQQSSAKSSPAMNTYAQPTTPQYQHPNRSWGPSPYQSPYSPQPVQQSMPARWPEFPAQSYVMGTPYPYGQLPSSFNMNANPATQHPIPGSYTRPHFNPQSRAFVPSGSSPLRYHGSVSAHSSPTGHGVPSPNMHQQQQEHHTPSKTDSIAKWGRPSHLPPKPPPSEDQNALDMSHQLAQNFSPGFMLPKHPPGSATNGQQALARGHSPHSSIRMGS